MIIRKMQEEKKTPEQFQQHQLSRLPEREAGINHQVWNGVRGRDAWLKLTF
jgi:hypothetical protein